ncbi:hypothetical protein MARPO_0149s0019 [Marchantia polymorpha]|uniref:Uncharacterized protein n=1 Tax=Marchantia polymorpha TaxID=3197 RepID=A0A2R6W5A0_MARPO|nr:hypothetical protein MARPO_0149s0019 [Marchantia polymorpha]|eukprot:PTQ29026.1 hypothetical protein MARPO_0149s0019 [Marchantia polymorpha]
MSDDDAPSIGDNEDAAFSELDVIDLADDDNGVLSDQNGADRIDESGDGGDEVAAEVSIVKERIAEFMDSPRLPSNIAGATIKKAPRTGTSLLNQCGIRILDADGCEYFMCLLDRCYNVSAPLMIKCTKKSTSNATKHLKTKHGVESSKTQSEKRQVAALAEQMDLSSDAFLQDPRRWFQTDRWRLLAKQLPVGPGGLKSINMQKHHVEMYKTVRRTIVSEIAEARRYYTIPFMSLNLDLIKSKTSNEKYLALRVCFNTRRQTNIGYNLAVRRFAPTTDERLAEKASAVLDQWSQGVLSEFGIEVRRDVLTSVSDSSSDVKRTLQVLMDAWWEWCISHLSHLAQTDAFGTAIDPVASKNALARVFFRTIKKVIESVNKSEYLQGAFEAAMIDKFSVYLKLLNAPQHRWSATALVLEQLLLCWDPLKLAYYNCQRFFSLTDEDQVQCL